MNVKSLKATILLVLSIVILTSCVGTVEDKNAKLAANQSLGDVTNSIAFDGLTKVTAISQDKVELYFYPADSDKTITVYEIYINNGPFPIKVTGNSLSVNASGLYIFTVTNLDMNSAYTFNMRAVLAGTNEPLKLDPTKSLSATTFKNETADFMGISSLTLGAGESGRDTLTVKWVPATIRGTNINPRSTDPVAYEIIYIKREDGAQNINNPLYTGANRVTVTIPNSISATPTLNKSSEQIIAGLIPGETYFFQVRAIHKGFITYKTDPSYLREQNTRFLKITMLNNAGLFDFNDALVSMTNPLGEAGLTNLNVSWIPAGGEFKQYRLCYKKVGNPADAEPIADLLTDVDIDLLLSNTTACLPLDANVTAQTLASLTSYAYYQAKVIACRTFACEANNRIKSLLMQKRVVANVAPFNGVLTISNPVDETKLKDVKITFDSPVVSAGYLNNFKLYCYSDASDLDPYALPTDGSVSAATGKASCDGIQLLTPMPTILSDYGLLNNLEIRLPVIDGNARYCLSLLPSISSPFLNQEDKTTAVIKCFTPEIKTPTIIQFPGRVNTCQLAGKNLSINWPLPTGGLYTKFVVLYREKKSTSNFFNFQDATQAYLTNNSTTYKWIDELPRTQLTHNLTSLVEGRTYNIGVLTYLDDGVSKQFAQYNVNIGECTLPLPTPTFNEWVDIFAVGPKEDGLTPATSTGVKSYILETLDSDGIPIDLKPSIADIKVPNVSDPLTASKQSSVLFDGVYGSMNALESNPLYQYSNSGIVKLAWKDVTFYNETSTMSTYIADPIYEANPGNKNLKKFGYRIYRSEDNQLTWIDLTKNSTQNKFQTVLNTGLVTPNTMSWRARNNSTLNSEQIVSFIDYSVKFSGNNEEVDRARVYHYKIIPVFDGKELVFNSLTNSTHHIVKVTLPPRNMALVHRMMANRTICLEMDKDISKSSGMHYSCEFNGLGASGLSKPWSQGSTVYDLGGDLLIDRFELSCPITRGDVNFSNSNSIFSGDNDTFKGLSSFGDPLKGCYTSDSGNARYEPNNGNAVATANYVYKQVIPGDCFGAEEASIASTGVCTTGLSNTRSYIYPGSPGYDYTPNCAILSQTGETAFNYLSPTSAINSSSNVFPIQSEFAAVYYSRAAYKWTGNWHLTPGNMKGGSGTVIQQAERYNTGSCNVNLNFVNNTGEYRPRWISVNSLFERTRTAASPSGLNLYNKKISEIVNHPQLYDSVDVNAPATNLTVSNRYKMNSTLARVVTSNSAKLPPLEGMASYDGDKLCSTYKVQVGLEVANRGFIPTDNKIYNKRLMRKKESTVAGAWPSNYTNAQVSSIEAGSYSENSIEKGCNTKTKTLEDGASQFVKGNYISTNFPHKGQIHPTLMVGSSSRDFNGDQNTEKCVSRFGVQDLVGNLAEHNSDQIFCDFNEDQLYLGLGKSVTQSVYAGSGTAFYDPNAVLGWVLSTPASGSCSVVEASGARASAYVNGDGSFASIYDYLGNVVSAIVSRAKSYDQDSVLSARNGDGSFLDFGQFNMAPKLSSKNTISMTDEDLTDGETPVIMPKYFNPALGIPLLCEKGCNALALDNTTISSDQICSNRDCGALIPLPGITNFPLNNSSFTNAGTGDSGFTDSKNSNNINDVPFNYVSDILVNPNPALNDLVYSSVNAVSTFPGVVRTMGFVIPRGEPLKMVTGGGYQQKAGRYSLNINGTYTTAERAIGYAYGVRCSVMINEDE